jgi:hypothetical protein
MTPLEINPGGAVQLTIAAGKRQMIGQWSKTPYDGGRLKIDVDERADGTGSIVVRVNDKEAGHWSGNIRTIGKSLEFHPDYPGQRLFGIMCTKDSFEFKNLKLTVRDGVAKRLR